MRRVRALFQWLKAALMVPVIFFRQWFLPLHSDHEPEESENDRDELP